MQDKRSVTIKLDEAIYRKMRLHSASTLMPIYKIMEEAIEKYLKEKKV